MSAGSVAPGKRLEVAAAVIQRDGGKFLLARRPAGKVYAGYWEFPGGKIERDERAADALGRELREELGIVVVQAYPWITRDYDYEHAAVRLRFFRVTDWRGMPHGRETQSLAWQSTRDLTVSPLLPANGPVLRALDLPATYGISNAAEAGEEAYLRRLERALRQGLQLVQVREKRLPPARLRELAARVTSLARRYGARVLLNGSAEMATRVGTDGVHLTSAELAKADARPAVALVGASCHDAAELARAVRIGADFVVLGPVLPTPSHPGSPGMGWETFSALVRDYPLPAYALGGMSRDDLETAWRAGAHGVAMMRGAWS